jgi:molybdate transport system permease protein
VFTWRGAVVAAAVASFPYIVRTARAAFEEIDISVREAARIDGASRAYLLLFLLLPLARRGIMAGIALAFARALGEFGATLMVAGNIPGQTQTMPLAIYDAVEAGQLSAANLLVFVLTIVAIAILWMVGRLGASI